MWSSGFAAFGYLPITVKQFVPEPWEIQNRFRATTRKQYSPAETKRTLAVYLLLEISCKAVELRTGIPLARTSNLANRMKFEVSTTFALRVTDPSSLARIFSELLGDKSDITIVALTKDKTARAVNSLSPTLMVSSGMGILVGATGTHPTVLSFLISSPVRTTRTRYIWGCRRSGFSNL